MLINLSNHPTRLWDNAQLDAASVYGDIVEIEFPAIDPHWHKSDIEHM